MSRLDSIRYITLPKSMEEKITGFAIDSSIPIPVQLPEGHTSLDVDKVTLASVPAAGRLGGGGVPGAQGSIVPGDILLCEISPGHFVLHRLVRIDGERLTLMGDGNLRGVERCSRAHVIARAVRIIRPDGSSAVCCSPPELRKARLWRRLLPLRRILLAVWRRTH